MSTYCKHFILRDINSLFLSFKILPLKLRTIIKFRKYPKYTLDSVSFYSVSVYSAINTQTRGLELTFQTIMESCLTAYLIDLMRVFNLCL